MIAAGPASSESDAIIRIDNSLFYRGGAPELLEQQPIAALVRAAAFSIRLAAAVVHRSREWDSVITHWLAPSALAALPARAPILAIAHGGDIHLLRRLHLLGATLHLLKARGAELVFVSEQLRTIARTAAPGLAHWLDRATIQPMGLDLARFAAIDRATTTPATILIAARLVPIKGIDVAIDALSYLRSRARLVIAGDGPERGALEARARGDISFVGAVSADQRDQLLRQASVVVVPSRMTPAGRSEGMPMIALEALAAGVPVVASEVGGLPELSPAVQLVRPEDPAALARAIERTLLAPLPPPALRAAVAHLDWSSVAPRLLRSS